MEAVVKLSSHAGLHGRPGALLVDLSNRFPQARIFLEKGGKRVRANSILNLLALGAKKGESLMVIVEGEEEKQIFEEVGRILRGEKH